MIIVIEIIKDNRILDKRVGTSKEIKTDLRDALIMWYFDNPIAMKHLRIDGKGMTMKDYEAVKSKKMLEAL